MHDFFGELRKKHIIYRTTIHGVYNLQDQTYFSFDWNRIQVLVIIFGLSERDTYRSLIKIIPRILRKKKS